MIIIAYIASLLFNLAVLAGTAWLVGWNHWSPWWFVLAVLVSCSGSTHRQSSKRQ